MLWSQRVFNLRSMGHSCAYLALTLASHEMLRALVAAELLHQPSTTASASH